MISVEDYAVIFDHTDIGEAVYRSALLKTRKMRETWERLPDTG